MDFKNLLIAIIIGIVIGAVVVGILLSQLRTVVRNNEASDYIKPGSFRVRHRQDLFLYRKVDRRPRPQQQRPPQPPPRR